MTQILIASIATHGNPLLVRRLQELGKYEIAAGHRRYEVAKKLVTVSVQIRLMDDQEFLEVLHVERSGMD